uniref:1-deoxy-D-xylulose 5-phosphate reductoisomerase putative 1-deoxy-D-xylulose 5-phosphate reductoisomerase n=1 Tax=Rhizophora mucronata TaxID=61149 RepID=A0A2P2KHM7_RHIMU
MTAQSILFNSYPLFAFKPSQFLQLHALSQSLGFSYPKPLRKPLFHLPLVQRSFKPPNSFIPAESPQLPDEEIVDEADYDDEVDEEEEEEEEQQQPELNTALFSQMLLQYPSSSN